MYSTYHLKSAQDVNTDILDSIKATFKSKPITIIVEEDENDFELTTYMKEILDERLLEDQNSYISAEDSLKLLSEKYGV